MIMKQKLFIFLILLSSVSICPKANAFDLKDIFGDKGGSSVIGNLLEGVFMKSDLSTKDLFGVWTTDQPAVAFKSDDLLKKAGGIAAASAIESKISPYFEQYGLKEATLTVNSDSTFTLKSKKLNLNGSIRQQTDGNFIFTIKALGKITIGEIPVYIQKTSKSMDVMFDSSKLKTLLNTLSKFLNMKSVSTVTSLLDSYDGLYIGFGMNKTGEVNSTDTQSDRNSTSGLLDILKGGKKNREETDSTTKKSTDTSSDRKSNGDKLKEAAGNALMEILSKKKK